MNGYTGDQNSTCYGCGASGYNQPAAQMPLSTAMPNSTSAQSPLPTGIPTGPTYSSSPFTMQFPPQQVTQGAQTTQMANSQNDLLAPITALNQPVPITTQSLQYINGFLRTMIGRKVTIDFLIGTGTLVDKTGTLLGVGANFILIREIETDDLLVCDFYSIKFVKIYY